MKLAHSSFLIICIVGILNTSCNPENGIVKEYFEDGRLYKQYVVDKDSLIQGELLVYYEDGSTLFESANFIDGKLHGTRTIYYENGAPEIIETYDSDILIDTLKVYYKSGALKRTAPYVEGVLIGDITSYYENGNVKEIVSFSDNLENGPFTEYHLNGKLKWQGTYLNGENEFGLLTEFDSTGIEIRKMMCDSQAVCHTIWLKDEQI